MSREIQKHLFHTNMQDEFTIKNASIWATNTFHKKITPSNISYLIQYGRIRKYNKDQKTFVKKNELLNYYQNFFKSRETNWRKKLGKDLNWDLSFENLTEKETTKHVHRLHPYKGKFIPQLVEYFLNQHTDNFKKQVFFKPNDIILDPFCGSGTTLVQANELSMHAVGIDISNFNVRIANAKLANYDLDLLEKTINKITPKKSYEFSKFEQELSVALKIYNKSNFPSPKNCSMPNYFNYCAKKENEFQNIYKCLIKKHNVQIQNQTRNNRFIDNWFLNPVRQEIESLHKQIKTIKNEQVSQLLEIILTRTVRSCRATKHIDLGTLKQPTTLPYYCRKHGKICRPILSVQSKWKKYAQDTLVRIYEFNKLKTNTNQMCLQGDSRNINIHKSLIKNKKFYELVKRVGIKSIFTSPPYVGMIDYHDQHAYAYDLFGYKRFDQHEIGSLSKGKSMLSRQNYSKSISQTLINCKQYLTKDFNVFIVANDKYNLYPEIAHMANMKIIKTYKRPVINRTERNRLPYSETIFHLK